MQEGGYSKCKRAGILSASGRVFYRRDNRYLISRRDLVSLIVSSKCQRAGIEITISAVIDQSDCEIPIV